MVLITVEGGALDCGPVGSIFVVLFIETDRRFIIKLTEVIWKLRISFVTTRDSYTITLGYSQTPPGVTIFMPREGRREEDVIYLM